MTDCCRSLSERVVKGFDESASRSVQYPILWSGLLAVFGGPGREGAFKNLVAVYCRQRWHACPALLPLLTVPSARRTCHLPQRAADADEPPELNFIRKHALAMKAQGLANPAARLFSNPAGERGLEGQGGAGQGRSDDAGWAGQPRVLPWHAAGRRHSPWLGLRSVLASCTPPTRLQATTAAW